MTYNVPILLLNIDRLSPESSVRIRLHGVSYSSISVVEPEPAGAGRSRNFLLEPEPSLKGSGSGLLLWSLGILW